MRCIFRDELEKARKRRLINEAFREVSRLTKKPIPLADEYFFKGACAGLLETPGFIPTTYIMEVARISNERGRGEEAIYEAEDARHHVDTGAH